MRRAAVLTATLAAALAAPAAGQDVKYWSHPEIAFPVQVDSLGGAARVAKVRLFAAPPRGRFTQVAEKAPADLDRIPGKQPGFVYTSRGDGAEDFAVQVVLDDGTERPKADDLKPVYRVVFDTRPPAVQLVATGTNTVEWQARDENLDDAGTRVEYRTVGQRDWTDLKYRFNPRDSYTFRTLGRDAQPIDVRVWAKDKAGHDAPSRPVRLPAADTSGRLSDERAASDAPPGRDARPPDGGAGQPQIAYVNTYDLTVEPKLTHVTRSGVRAAHLYVKDLSDGYRNDWRKAERVYEQNPVIRPDTPNPVLKLPYRVAKDGRYGFVVIPESGAGLREPDPAPSTPPQHVVEVDKTPPKLSFKTVTVGPGVRGPRVRIEWAMDEKNPLFEPITLEYAEHPSAGGWEPIAVKLPDSGQYVWEVGEKVPYKFWVRIRATDRAGNSGSAQWDKEVNIDLDRPAAVIETIRPAGGDPGYQSERPAFVPSSSPPPPHPPPASTPPASAPPVPPISTQPPAGAGTPVTGPTDIKIADPKKPELTPPPALPPKTP